MEKTRVAIIGCGGIANGKHMPSLSRVADCEMVAFCDIVIERAQKAAAKYGTEDAKVFENYKDLLEGDTKRILEGRWYGMENDKAAR